MDHVKSMVLLLCGLTSCVLKSTIYRKFIETIICFTYNGIVKKEVIIMQVEIKIDSSYIDPKVIILTASSVIWEMDSWSIVKQTGIYFSIISVVMLPIAYFAYWMEHSVGGFLIYFGIFAFIFVVIWIIQFGIGRYNVRKMNEKLFQTKDNRNE